MKRVTRILIAVAVMTTLMISSVFAAGTVLGVDANKTAVKQGDKVEVTFSVEGNTGFKAYEIHLDYDKASLELVSLVEKDLSLGSGKMFYGSTDTGIATLAYMNKDGKITGDGDLFTATFKVKSDAKDGDYNVTAKKVLIGMDGNNQLNPTIEKATVAVKAPHSHSYGNWTDAKDGKNHVKACACGDKVTEAHKYGDWKVTKEATETEKGSKERVCSVCGYVDKADIAATGGNTGTGGEGEGNTGDADKPATDNTDKTTQTGDDFNVLLFGAIAFAALIAAGGTVLVRRKSTK